MTGNDAGEPAAIRRAKIRRRQTITVVVALLLVVLATIIILSRTRSRQESLGNIVTSKVRRTTITQEISATGSVTAQTGAQVRIGSQITGRIKRLYADVGSKVKAGQVIATLDLPDIKAQLDEAVASLRSAQVALSQQRSGLGLQRTTVATDITKAQAAVDSARANYLQAQQNASLQVSASEAAVRQANATAVNAKTALGRQQQLFEKGYVAAQDVDNARAEADVAAAQLDTARQNLALTQTKSRTDVRTAQNALNDARAALSAARAGSAQNTIKRQQIEQAAAAVSQAQAQVKYWQAQYAKTVIRTPISGTVLSLDVQQGETIAAGLSAPTLIRVTDLSRLQVDALVDETDIGSVQVGQPATITVDAYPNRSFTGHVVKIASGATTQENVVTYDTTIAVQNTGGLLRPDMTATAGILVGRRTNVLAVPMEAVHSSVQGQSVYVVREGRVVTQPVVTGISSDTMTEIMSGLRDGDTIVLAGYQPTTGVGGRGPRGLTPFGAAGGRPERNR